MKMQKLLLAAAAVALLGACERTQDGDVVVNRPADVDVKTTQDTVKLPSVEMKKDTINTPVVGTKTDTFIVKKPVVGTKQTEVKVPVVKKP